MNQRSLSAQRGVGIIEILVSLVVVAIGLLALARMEGWLTQTVAIDKARAEAVEYAQQSLEEFTNQVTFENFNAASTSGGLAATVGFVEDPDGTITGANSNAEFTRSWLIEDSADPVHKEVTVKVTWENADGDPESVSLRSYIKWTAPAKVAGGAGEDNTRRGPFGNDLVAQVGPDPDDPLSPLNDDETDHTQARKDGANPLGDTGYFYREYIVLPEDGVGVGETRTAIQDADGDVLLTIYTPFADTIAVTGTVYMQEDGFPSDMGVIMSDAGFCAFTPTEPPAAVTVDLAPFFTDASLITATTQQFINADYYCITGPGWGGRVGVLGFIDASFSYVDSICPTLSRRYFNFDFDNDANPTTVEGLLGINSSHFGHDFILADLTVSKTVDVPETVCDQQTGVDSTGTPIYEDTNGDGFADGNCIDVVTGTDTVTETLTCDDVQAAIALAEADCTVAAGATAEDIIEACPPIAEATIAENIDALAPWGSFIGQIKPTGQAEASYVDVNPSGSTAGWCQTVIDPKASVYTCFVSTTLPGPDGGSCLCPGDTGYVGDTDGIEGADGPHDCTPQTFTAITTQGGSATAEPASFTHDTCGDGPRIDTHKSGGG